MALQDGTYQLGPDAGELVLRTGRTGLGTKAGHDLVLEATQWAGTVLVDAADPARSAVAVEVVVDSLEVREGTGGVKPLTRSDRAQIRRNIREKILRTAQHPTITFRSTRISGTPDKLIVDGDLTILGTARPITVQASVDAHGSVRGSTTVVQTQWGITPYTAFFGALKLADEVAVDVDAILTPDAEQGMV